MIRPMNKNGSKTGSGRVSKIEELRLDLQKPRLTESVRLAEMQVASKSTKASTSRKAKGNT
jgi:hypothetical protein